MNRKGGGIKFSVSKKKHNITTKNPFIIHTLTGSKENIKKRIKSVNKTKKFFGVKGGTLQKTESIDLQQILMTDPILDASRNLGASNTVLNKYLKQRGEQGFPLTRLSNNINSLGEPVTLRKEGRGRKIDGIMKPVYEIIDGRHRVVKAIVSGKTHINAKII